MSFAQRRKFLWTLFLAGLFLTIAALAALTSNATTFARLSFRDLAQQSTAIARLHCVGSSVLWDHGELWTETRFAVVELQKGALPSTVAIRMMGGSDGTVHSHVDGVPQFRTGEDIYLFLWNREGEPYRVLGWAQGTFRIARNSLSGAETVTQDSSSAAIFDAQMRSFQRSGVRNLPVPLFQTKLRKALAGSN